MAKTARGPGNGPVTTLIVDDEEDVRALVRVVIDRSAEAITVVGEASSGADALLQAERADPTVIVIDDAMPGLSGSDTVIELRARRPGQICVLCSPRLDSDVIARARAAGADAWVSKDQLRVLPDLIRSLVEDR